MEPTQPTVDELEVSVFGGMYGESICAHAGDGNWIVVDSCIEPERRQPAAITYLERIGLEPSECVRLVLATHWDDDHSRGMRQIVERCDEAEFALSGALGRREIVGVVLATEGMSTSTGLDELRQTLELCGVRDTRVHWARANLPLFPNPPDPAKVVALSPSEDAFERSLLDLAESATKGDRVLWRRYRAPEGPNGSSVAVLVRNAGIGILLGADLERSNNPETGWAAVAKYAAQPPKATVLKVPHHGSADAHEGAMWTTMLEERPIGIVSSWSRGGRNLPTSDDLERLMSLCESLYITFLPRASKSEPTGEVLRLLRKTATNRIRELQGWGHVRARRTLTESAWRVDLSGDAACISP